MDDLQQFYRNAVGDQAAELEQALQLLEANAPDADAAVRRLAHLLKGSGSSFGFAEVTRAAAETEQASTTQQLWARGRELAEILDEIISNTDAMTIAVVEDDPLINHFIGAELAGTPYDPVSFSSIEDARRLHSMSPPPTLVLLDLFLPDGDGRTLLQDMRGAGPLAEVPVVVMSAASQVVVQHERDEVAATAFISKPFQPGELLRLINDVIGDRDTPVSAELPEAPSTVSEERAPDVPGGETMDRPRRVLLAEDDALSAALVVHRLENEGYEVEHHADGLSALSAAEADRFGLIVLDIQMPGADGFEVLQEIRSDPAMNDVPVVILTAVGSERDVVRGFELGADDYILKPFSPAELTARLNRFTRS